MNEEERLVARVIELATQYGRYGYRRITALLRREGWRVRPQESGEDMEERRIEGTAETAQERKTVVE